MSSSRLLKLCLELGVLEDDGKEIRLMPPTRIPFSICREKKREEPWSSLDYFCTSVCSSSGAASAPG